MDVEISLCDFVSFLLGISLATYIKLFVKNFDFFLRYSNFFKDFQIKKNLFKNSNEWLSGKMTLDSQNLCKIGWSESNPQSYPLVSMCTLQCVQHPTCIKIKNSHINNSGTLGSTCCSVSNWVFNANLLMFLP